MHTPVAEQKRMQGVSPVRAAWVTPGDRPLGQEPEPWSRSVSITHVLFKGQRSSGCSHEGISHHLLLRRKAWGMSRKADSRGENISGLKIQE